MTQYSRLERIAPKALPPAERKRLRRRIQWAVALAGVFVLVVAAILLVPRVALGTGAARAALVDRLQTMTGQPVAIDGDVSFSLFPRTRVVADRLRIGRSNDFAIDRVVADFDASEALAGNASLSRVVLVRPEYVAGVGDAHAAASPDEPTRPAQLRGLLRSLLQRFDGLQILEIRNALFRPEGSHNRSGFSNGNFTLTQSARGSSLHVAGSMVWQGQPTDIDLDIGDPQKMLASGTSNVDLSVSAPPLTASFSGDIGLADNAAINGSVQFSADSLSRAIEWLGNPSVRVPEIGSVALGGNLTLVGGTAKLEDADLTVAHSHASGALEADLGQVVPVVGGTMAFSDLDFTPFARAIAPLPDNPFDVERPIDVSFADAMKLDVRFSADRAHLGRMPMTDVAAVLLIGDGKAKVDVGDATVFGGEGRARIVFDRTGATPTVTGRMSATGIDTAPLLKALGIDAISVTGRSTVQLDLRSPLIDWGTIARKATIEADITAHDGVISGFDPAVFKEPGARPLAAGSSGTSLPFDALRAKIVSHGPRVSLDHLDLRNKAGTLTAHGEFSAADATTTINGQFEGGPGGAAGPQPGAAFTPSKPVAFILSGHWPNPDVTTR